MNSSAQPTKHRLLLTVSVLLVAGMAVIVWHARRSGGSVEPSHGTATGAVAPPQNEKGRAQGSGKVAIIEPASSIVSTEPLAPPPTEGDEGREVASGDPFVRKFVNEKGETTRLIRNNPQGLPISDTRYADGQTTRVENVYAEDGTLVRVQKLQNDRVIESQEFR